MTDDIAGVHSAGVDTDGGYCRSGQNRVKFCELATLSIIY